jgi:hypothetical protein
MQYKVIVSLYSVTPQVISIRAKSDKYHIRDVTHNIRVT